MRKFDNTIEFDAAKFTWDIGTGVTEASDLGLRAGYGKAPFVQVYNDACDAGMTLVNTKKGTKCDFVLIEEKINDGDLLFWKFESVNQPVGATKIVVTIFND